MTQNREAPAYQEYAAQMMARIDYRVMSLSGRGLLYTLRNECWVNGCVPADAGRLAKVLGVALEEVASALDEVRPFFVEKDGMLRSQELDDYRMHIDERRERQREGGRKGAEMTNGAVSGKPPGKPRVPRRDGRGSAGGSPGGSLVQNSQVQNSPIHGIDGGAERQWVNDYERASRGQ